MAKIAKRQKIMETVESSAYQEDKINLIWQEYPSSIDSKGKPEPGVDYG